MGILSVWKLCLCLAFNLLSNGVIKQVVCQCDDATRPMVLSSTNTPQYFYSPEYPNNYPPNADCAWHIEAPSEYDKIILNIEEFSSQQYDFLTIYEGQNTSGTLVEQVDDTNQNQFNAYVSTGNQLYFTFQSDASNEQKGFNILFFSNNSASQYPCGETISLTSTEEQVFMSPNLPNPLTGADSCSWQFTTTAGNITFKMKFLDMNSCNPEYLTFYEDPVVKTLTGRKGNSSSGTQVEQLCSTAFTYTFKDIVIYSSNAFVEWIVSDETDNFYGFLFTFGLAIDITNDTGFIGINLTYPVNLETIYLTLPEDTPTGNVNESVAVIVLTYTGDDINLNISVTFSQTTVDTVSLSDTQIFEFTGTQPQRNLTLVSSLDYEVIDHFNLLVTLMHPDVPEVTYSVTFDVTVTDVDDVAPTFDNLPNSDTVKRTRRANYHLFTVSATDGDGTAENRVITYDIFYMVFLENTTGGINSKAMRVIFVYIAGNDDGVFRIEDNGKVRLEKAASQISANVLQYNLNIVAYSGSKLGTFGTLTVFIDPDNPPECTPSTVWAETLNINSAGAGTVITFLDTWTCTDDYSNVTYSIESVTPNVTSSLFDIDVSTGVITLLRTVESTEFEIRQFLIQLVASDSHEQTDVISVYINVTTLECLPNPRNLYVRMDQEIGGVLLSDFNCTITKGMTYSLKQYPQGTFAVSTDANGNTQLILTASVVKIKFYGLEVTITDGFDIAVLKFKVIIQTKQCGVSSGTSVSGNIIRLITFISMLLRVVQSMFT